MEGCDGVLGVFGLFSWWGAVKLCRYGGFGIVEGNRVIKDRLLFLPFFCPFLFDTNETLYEEIGFSYDDQPHPSSQIHTQVS